MNAKWSSIFRYANRHAHPHKTSWHKINRFSNRNYHKKSSPGISSENRYIMNSFDDYMSDRRRY